MPFLSSTGTPHKAQGAPSAWYQEVCEGMSSQGMFVGIAYHELNHSEPLRCYFWVCPITCNSR